MVRCMLAIVQELKASDLTQKFCEQEGISYTATLHCREQLKNFEVLQDKVQGAASTSELRCILQKQGKGLQKLQHFLLRLHCLSSFYRSQETSCLEGHEPSSRSLQQPGNGNADEALGGQPQESGSRHLQVKIKQEVKEEVCSQDDRGEQIHDDHQFVKRSVNDGLGPSKYPCPKCSMKFRSKLHLRKHLREHSSERPFLCPHCPHQANRRDNMRSHCLLMHGVEIRLLPKDEVRNPKYVKPARRVFTTKMEPVAIVKQEGDDATSEDRLQAHETDTADTFDFAVPNMDNTDDSNNADHSFNNSNNNNNNNNNSRSRLEYSSTEQNSLSTSQYHHSIFDPSPSNSTNNDLKRDDDQQMDSEHDSPRSSTASHRVPYTYPRIPYASQRGGDFVGTKTRRHYCDYCNYSSLELCLMKRHVLTKHRHEPRQQLFCPLCSFVTLQRTKYNEHMDREHTSDEGRYACNKCNYTSIHKSNLYRHLNTHTGQPRQLRCPLCPYVCAGNLNRHIRTRHTSATGSPHQCPDCPFRTWFVDKFRAHLNSHVGQDKFTCDGCNWSTYYRRSFDQHMALYHRVNAGGEGEKVT